MLALGVLLAIRKARASLVSSGLSCAAPTGAFGPAEHDGSARGSYKRRVHSCAIRCIASGLRPNLDKCQVCCTMQRVTKNLAKKLSDAKQTTALL